MRDIKALHPVLQKKITELQTLCLKNGINIGISECVRTVEEQNALYAQGRTKPGNIVTNCKGTDFQSLHQWGVAFDFYLIMDVDKDGSTADDAYNNSTGLFDKVGKLGQSIGLEWGGAWGGVLNSSPIDKPHFQLPDWGSTANKLKSLYGTPDKFIVTWNKKDTTPSKSKDIVIPAESKDKQYSGTWQTKTEAYLRTNAGKNNVLIVPIPKGNKVTCYGYYTKIQKNGHIWLFVQYGKYTGYVYLNKLKKV